MMKRSTIRSAQCAGNVIALSAQEIQGIRSNRDVEDGFNLIFSRASVLSDVLKEDLAMISGPGFRGTITELAMTIKLEREFFYQVYSSICEEIGPERLRAVYPVETERVEVILAALDLSSPEIIRENIRGSILSNEEWLLLSIWGQYTARFGDDKKGFFHFCKSFARASKAKKNESLRNFATACAKVHFSGLNEKLQHMRGFQRFLTFLDTPCPHRWSHNRDVFKSHIRDATELVTVRRQLQWIAEQLEKATALQQFAVATEKSRKKTGRKLDPERHKRDMLILKARRSGTTIAELGRCYDLPRREIEKVLDRARKREERMPQ